MISLSLNFVCSDKNVLTIALMEWRSIKLLSFIFEIRQNYIIVFFLNHVEKINLSIFVKNQFFICKHKISKCNTKIPIHY